MAIEFRLRDFAYPYSIIGLRRFLEKSQFFPPEELANFQFGRVKCIVTHAYENVPYYKALFKRERLTPDDIKTLSDLHRVPSLSKNALRDNYLGLTARNAKRFKPLEQQTTGSSGAPARVLSDKSSRSMEFAFYWRYWNWAGYRLGDTFAELASHHFVADPDRTERPFSMNRLSSRLILNSLQISPHTIKDFVKPLRKYKPKFLKGLASALYFFALWMQESGVDDIPFRAIFATGEMLSEEYRNLIEKVFHCQVLDSYGHMEGALAICQCPEGGYHVNSEYGYVEFLDSPSLSETNVNMRTVVATSLHKFAMPLIRYEVGDLFEFYKDPPVCPCGRTLPLIKRIHGRHEDVIITPDERYVTSMFTTLNFVEGFNFVQFIQEKKDALSVNLIKTRNYKSTDSDKLMNVLRRLVGNHMKIKLNYIEPEQIVRDPSGKIRMVISLL